jgi:hypothetical protein
MATSACMAPVKGQIVLEVYNECLGLALMLSISWRIFSGLPSTWGKTNALRYQDQHTFDEAQDQRPTSWLLPSRMVQRKRGRPHMVPWLCYVVVVGPGHICCTCRLRVSCGPAALKLWAFVVVDKL